MKLKEMFGKAKTWTMEHKKEILIAVAGVAGGVVVYKIVGGKIFKSSSEDAVGTYVSFVGGSEMPIPEIDVGTVTELWKADDGSIDAIVNDLKLADIGKLGESLKAIEGITDESNVCAVIGFANEVAET